MANGKEKKLVFDNVERNREAIALLCDNIFYFAELGSGRSVHGSQVDHQGERNFQRRDRRFRVSAITTTGSETAVGFE